MASYTTPTPWFWHTPATQARSQQIAEMKKQAEERDKNVHRGGFIIFGVFVFFLPF